MTTNLVQDAKTTDNQAKEARGLAIGETDAHVFNCPSCARPLSEGTSKCPGCGVRLIMGVRLKRASAILGLGVAIGVLIGGLTTAAAITLSLHDDPGVAVKPVASAAPVAVASPAAVPSYVVTNPGVPTVALSALSGTAVVNGRIAVDAETLTSTLARSNSTTIEVARALRSLAADAALGIDLVGRLAAWPDAKPLQAGLDDFYHSMADTARDGLRFSLTDDADYRKAGADMLTVLSSLGSIDARSRAFAAANDLELPPVAIPK